jgi:hypothetical protein
MISFMAQRHKVADYADPALFIMDDYTALFRSRQTISVVLPAHTSDLTHPLDLESVVSAKRSDIQCMAVQTFSPHCSQVVRIVGA